VFTRSSGRVERMLEHEVTAVQRELVAGLMGSRHGDPAREYLSAIQDQLNRAIKQARDQRRAAGGERRAA
jgi:hypothetical protein